MLPAITIYFCHNTFGQLPQNALYFGPAAPSFLVLDKRQNTTTDLHPDPVYVKRFPLFLFVGGSRYPAPYFSSFLLSEGVAVVQAHLFIIFISVRIIMHGDLISSTGCFLYALIPLTLRTMIELPFGGSLLTLNLRLYSTLAESVTAQLMNRRFYYWSGRNNMLDQLTPSKFSCGIICDVSWCHYLVIQIQIIHVYNLNNKKIIANISAFMKILYIISYMRVKGLMINLLLERVRKNTN